MRWPDWIRDDNKPYNFSRKFDNREKEFERRSRGGPSGSNILYFVLGGFTMLFVIFFVGASMEMLFR